jgi:hypothetical protein
LSTKETGLRAVGVQEGRKLERKEGRYWRVIGRVKENMSEVKLKSLRGRGWKEDRKERGSDTLLYPFLLCAVLDRSLGAYEASGKAPLQIKEERRSTE